jgi:hypothetical protein
MRRNLDALLVRGLFGAVFSLVALATAATQAASFEGEVRFEAGRLELLAAPEAVQCAVAQQLAPARNAARRG